MLRPNDFKKATLQQLIQIVEHEDCEQMYKEVAKAELEQRTALRCG